MRKMKDKVDKLYNFKYMWKKDKEYGNILATELEDGTQFIVLGNKSMVIRYPKKKFTKLFNQQKKNRRGFYELEYQRHEIKALIKGFEMAEKKLKKK